MQRATCARPMCNDVPQRGAATAVHQAALTLLDIEIEVELFSAEDQTDSDTDTKV